MNLDLNVRVSLARKGTRLCESTLVHQLLVRVSLLATGTVPDDSLNLTRTIVAINVAGSACTCEIVVTTSCSHLLLLMHLSCI